MGDQEDQACIHDCVRKARYIVAPMVDQSELAWRLLSRHHGAQLCYTPMLHATQFVRDPTYRKEHFVSCSEDRPLVVQFCANNPDVFVEAAKMVAPHCDGIDLNLGCPQMIAKRGYYGAFLDDNWDLIHKLVSAVRQALPHTLLSCKIRVFSEVDKSVRYAQMLENAGCQLLSVHGRTKCQKGAATGLASWQHIKAIKENVSIPVVSNGNIQYFADIDRCFKETGADGIMIAEGNLHNPALFENRLLPAWELALEYLDLVLEYPAALSCIRGHLFKLFHHTLSVYPELRQVLAKSDTNEEFRQLANVIKDKCKEGHEQYLKDPSSIDCAGLPVPHWICQPYMRPPPAKANGTSADSQSEESSCNGASINTTSGDSITTQQNADRKRVHQEQLASQALELGISKKKLKRMQNSRAKRVQDCVLGNEAQKQHKKQYSPCEMCKNPMGARCDHRMCRGCCKNLCILEVDDCQEKYGSSRSKLLVAKCHACGNNNLLFIPPG